MKYLKTYENILTNLFKKKQLPKEVIDFGDSLVSFIEQNINNNEWDVFSNEYKSPTNKRYNKLSIYIDPYDMEDADEIVELFYNDERKVVLYCFIPKLNFLEDIQEYLKDIIKNITVEDVSTRGSYATGEDRFFIEIDKLDDIIKN